MDPGGSRQNRAQPRIRRNRNVIGPVFARGINCEWRSGEMKGARRPAQFHPVDRFPGDNGEAHA
jgi:hypothetical protein